MLRTLIGHLDPEDLTRWQLLTAKQEAQSRAPSHFSAREIEEHELTYLRIGQEFCERYAIPAEESWKISPYTGVIYVEAD